VQGVDQEDRSYGKGDKPSQVETRDSTWERWSGVSFPKTRINFAKGHKVLSIESTLPQKWNGKSNLESRAPQARRTRNERHQSAINVLWRNAEDETWAYLGGETEIYEPDLSSLRRPHLDSSRRSNSRKI
jgi:hypothetical protein